MDDEITYLGFEDNGRQVELWLGEAFNSHIPSRNEIEYTNCGGQPVAAWAGDTLRRCDEGGVHGAHRERWDSR